MLVDDASSSRLCLSSCGFCSTYLTSQLRQLICILHLFDISHKLFESRSTIRRMSYSCFTTYPNLLKY